MNSRRSHKQMNNKIYDVLAFIGRIALPALAVFVTALGDIWSIPYYQQISLTLTALAVFINSLLKIDSAKYLSDKQIVNREQ